MAISLDEMQSELGKATAGTGIATAAAKPGTIGLEEMQGELDTVVAGKRGSRASWGDVLRDVPGQIKAFAAQSIAGMKLRELEELRDAYAKDDPQYLREHPELEQAIERERAVAREATAGMAEHTTSNMSTLQSGVQSGLMSLPITAGAMAVGITTRNPALAAASIGPSTSSQKYAEMRSQGIERLKAAKHADFQGFVEVATELLPTSALINKSPIGKKLLETLFADVPGEIAATYLQGASDYVAMMEQAGAPVTPELVWQGLVKQNQNIPTTVIASLVGSGVSATVMAGTNRMAGTVLEATNKKDDAKATTAFDALATADPAKADEVAAEVGKTDPKKAEALTKRKKRLAKFTPEELVKVGEEAVKKAEELTLEGEAPAAASTTKPNADALLKELETAPAKTEETEAAPPKEEVVTPKAGKVTDLTEARNERDGKTVGSFTQQILGEKPMSKDLGERVNHFAHRKMLEDLGPAPTPPGGLFFQDQEKYQAWLAALTPYDRMNYKVHQGFELNAEDKKVLAMVADGTYGGSEIAKKEVFQKTKIGIAHDSVNGFYRVYMDHDSGRERGSIPLESFKSKEEAEQYKMEAETALHASITALHAKNGYWSNSADRIEKGLRERLEKARKAPQQSADSISESLETLEDVAVKSPEPPTPRGSSPGVEPRFLLGGNPVWHSWRRMHEAAKPVYNELRNAALEGRVPSFLVVEPRLSRNSNAVTKKQIKTTHDLMDVLIADMPADLPRALFVRLRSKVAAVPIEFTTQPIKKPDGTVTAAAGLYVPRGHSAGNKIILRIDEHAIGEGAWVSETFLHEVVHSAVYDFMLENPNHPLTKQAEKLFGAAKELLPKVIAQVDATEGVTGYKPGEVYDYSLATGGAVYGLSDVHEFIAEANTADQFQRLLVAAARFDKTGVLQQFQSVAWKIVDVIADMLGFTSQDAKLLHNIWDVTNKLIEAQNKMLEDASYKAAQSAVIYKSGGVPVTREDIRGMFNLGKAALQKIPFVHVVEGQIKARVSELVRNLAPETLGVDAEQGGAVVAKAITWYKAMDAQSHGRSLERRKFWNHNISKARGFLINYDKGTPVGELFEIPAQGYRALMADIADRDHAAGIEYENEENYITHLFEKADPSSDADLDTDLKRAFGAKFGDPYFMKNRSGATIEQILAMKDKKGNPKYKLRYENPEDVIQARLHASHVAHARISMMNELAGLGLAVKIDVGKGGALLTERPEGYAKELVRSPNGNKYWVHKDVGVIIHNAFFTKSLWTMDNGWGALYRAGMAVKNTIVPIQLLGFFHAMHVGLMINNAAAATRALKTIIAGDYNPKSWAPDALRAMVPFQGVWSQGAHKVLKAYWGQVPLSELSEADKMLLTYMQEGGLVPGLASQDILGSRQKFQNALQLAQGGRKSQALKAAFHLPFAIIESLQYPMFHVWIPQMKIAAYAKDVATAMQLDPSLVTDAKARTLTLRHLAKSVDNRFGEMCYDTLFWNRWVKDIAVLNTLSVGWQIGFLREYGGGLVDTVASPFREKSFREQARTGDLDKAIFSTMYFAGAAAIGGLLTMVLSGEPPEEPLDYFYPYTGEKDADGRKQRINTVFFTKEYASIYMHMRNEGMLSGLLHLIQNKASGVIGLTTGTFHGIDSLGRETVDPNGDAYKQIAERVAHVFGEMQPISLEPTLEADRPGVKALAVLGFAKAPKYAMESAVEGKVKSMYQKYYGQKRTPYERVEFSDDAKELRELREKGDTGGYNAKLAEIVKKYNLTVSEKAKLRKASKDETDKYVVMFSRLPWERQKIILDEMTPEERKRFLPHSNKDHLRRHYKPKEK